MKREDSLLVQVLSLPLLVIGSVVLLVVELLKIIFKSEKCDLTDEELEQILKDFDSSKD